MKIESKVVDITKSAEEIFEFLADFTRFSLLLPDKVENWTATKERCSFTIKGLTDFGMKITDLKPHNTIIISNDEDVQMPVKFTFTWHLTPQTSSCQVQACFDLNVNPMMAMMIKKPFGEFVNALVDKLKEKMENS
ncbi:MAG: SRPBCC family protein [Bacteroidales bacterium]|jgi:carbon monoxide dehydrogenase subunit G|nr:SRPBCC family protein [Bacteroidales bacterium]